MPYCPDCGAEATESQAYCGDCGASLDREERQKESSSNDGIHVTELDDEGTSEKDTSAEGSSRQTPNIDGEQLDEGSEKTNITVGLILSYIVGGLVIFTGVSEFLSGFLSGLFMILAGSFVLPITRKQIESFLNIQFSRWVVILVFLIVYGGAAFLNATTRTAVS